MIFEQVANFSWWVRRAVSNNVFARESNPVLNEEVTYYANIFDFADEIWFHIYSYLHLERFLADKDGANFTFGNFLNTMSLVCKGHCALLSKYVRKVPHDFVYQGFPFGIREMLWACENNVKVNSIDLTFCRSLVECNVFLYFLKYYNVRDLQTLRIALDQDCLYTGHWMTGIALRYGIPCEDLYCLNTFTEFQSSLTKLLPSRMCSLKRLDLKIRKMDIYIPLLVVFSNVLEHLDLSLDENVGDVDLELLDGKLDEVFVAIEGMTKLKKLKLKVSFPISFSINSSSLEEIDTSESASGFRVGKVMCASLKKITFKYDVDRFLRIENRRSLDQSFVLGKKDLEFCASIHPCQGIVVPGSCIIRMVVN